MKFNTKEEAQSYLKERKQDWENLRGYIEQRDGFFYVWFNVWN